MARHALKFNSSGGDDSTHTGETEMSKFANAVMSNEPPKRRPMATILTGRSGIGKTRFCSTIPKVWIIPVEQGLEGASKDHAWGCFKDNDGNAIQPTTLSEFKDSVKVFVERNRALPVADRYKHLAVDSLSGLEELINNETVGHEKIAHMDAKEFQTAYTAAMPRWTAVRNMFDTLRDQFGLHVWLIAHSAETKEATETGEQYTKWDLAITGTGQKLIQLRTFWRKWAECVYFIDWDAKVTKGSIGKKSVGKYEARILRTRETPGHYAKNRYNLPPLVPAEWQDLEKAIKQGLPATVDKTASQLEAIIAQLPPAEQDSVRADMKAAKTATAMAGVLSRAQGILSVINNDREDDEQAEAKAEEKSADSFFSDSVPAMDLPAEDPFAPSESLDEPAENQETEQRAVESDDEVIAKLIVAIRGDGDAHYESNRQAAVAMFARMTDEQKKATKEALVDARPRKSAA